MLSPRQFAERPGGLLRHPSCSGFATTEFDPSRLTYQGGGVEPGQHIRPSRPGGDDVLIGLPRDKPAVQRRRGQPLSEIAGEDFLQHDGQRPAVRHHVVEREHHPVSFLCRADQRHAERRLVDEVEHRFTFGSTQPQDLPVGVDVAVDDLELGKPPSHCHIGWDHLHRLVELLAESSREIGVAADHGAHRLA